MKGNGWQPIDDVKEGAVLTCEARHGVEVPVYGNMHLHIGFYVGNDRAVSNGSRRTLMPQEHDYTYDGTRKIERIWWHDALEE